MADLATLRVSVDSREVKAATNDLNALSRASGQAERSAIGLSNAAKLFGGALAAAGIFGLVTSVAKANAEFQSLNASLKVATGSSAAATAAFNEIRKFAAETPYQLNQTVEAFLKLKNLGLDPSMASLRSYGNTAASMGKGLNQMIEAVADASTMEFERLKEFGIRAKQQKDTVTFTFQGVATTVKKNSEEIQQYLINIGNTKFAGAMDAQMKTLNGRMSNLKDNIDNLYVSLGNAGATNVFSRALDAASNAVLYLLNNLDKILRAAEITIVAVAGMAAAFIAFRAALGVQAILAYITQLVAMQFALGATSIASALAGAGLKALQAALASTGFGLAVIAIGALVGAIYSLATAQSRAREETNGHIASLKQLAQARSVDWAQKRGEQEIEARLLERDINLIREKNKAQAVGKNKNIEYITPDLAAKRERLDALRIGIKEADVLKEQADAMAKITTPAAAASAAIASTGKETKKANDTLMEYYKSLVETGKYLGITNEYEIQATKAREAGREALAALILEQGKSNAAKQLELDNEKMRQDFIKGTLADLQFENSLINMGVQEREKAIAMRALENAKIVEGTDAYNAYLAAIATASDAKISGEQDKRITALREEIILMGLSGDAAVLQAAKFAALAVGLNEGTDAYEKFIAKATEEAGLQKTVDGLQAIKDAMQEVKDMTFDIDLEGVFGNVGKAVGGLVNVYDDFAKRQKVLALAMSKDNKDEAGRRVAQQKAFRNEINLYGNLAASAKGFFKEKSTGYKVMQAAETAFRAFEFAMSLKAMAMNTAEATNTVATEATKTAAQTASGASKIFSQLGAWAFPVVAAMIGVMASLGGKGGSVATPSIPSAEDMQAQQGAGSVLGDSAAKSDSINRALEIMAANSNSDLEYSNQMLLSLRSIQNNMANLSNSVARQISVSGGMFDTSKLGLGSSGKGGVLGIGAKSTTRELQDLGINIVSSTIAEIVAGGIKGNTYQVVQQVKKKSGFFGIGGSTRTSYQTTTGAIDQDVRNSIVDVVASLRQGLIDGAAVIGLDGAQAILDSFQVNIGKISLKGLTGAEIEEQLNAVFSKVGDQMAGALLPSLTSMQKIGEGLFETFARVAREYQVVDVALRSIGKEFGAVGISSVAARSALVQMFESLDQFVEQTNYFRDNFLTEAEQLAPITKAVADELQRLGLSSIATIEQFKMAVLGLDLTTTAGQEAYFALLQLAPAFKKVADAQNEIAEKQLAEAKAIADAAEKAAKAVQDLQNKRVSMEIQLLEAQGNATEALTMRRELELAAMDETLRGLQQQIYAAQDAKAANDAAAISAKAVADENARQLTAATKLATDRNELEIQLLEAQGFAVEALAARRAIELGLIDASLVALKEQIWAAQAKAASDAEAAKAAEDAANLQAKAVEDAANAMQQYQDALASVTQTVMDEINRLRGINTASSSALLKAQFASLTAQARTGNLDALGKLPELSRSIEEATLGTATSALEVARIRAWLDASLSETLAQQGASSSMVNATSSGLTFDGNSTMSANTEQTSGELSNMSNVLYTALYQVARNTGKSYELLDRWDGDGLPDIREDASDYY